MRSLGTYNTLAGEGDNCLKCVETKHCALKQSDCDCSASQLEGSKKSLVCLFYKMLIKENNRKM